MHTTTVRFDGDTWALVVAHCQRLGIAHAEFIRGAVLLRLGSLLLETERAERLERDVAALSKRVVRVTGLIERVAVFVGFVTMPARRSCDEPADRPVAEATERPNRVGGAT